MTRSVSFEVNGVTQTLDVEDRHTLADVLRERLSLTGTHIGCEHGVCGACTVLVDRRPARSCLLFAVQCEGVSITTIEGLAAGDDLHPLQRSFSKNHALQCGFCTPGFIMLAAGALDEDPEISDSDIEEWLASNLCRCTGYVNIVRAVRDARDEMRKG